jgi:DNA-binding Xre family transcriptional regulator
MSLVKKIAKNVEAKRLKAGLSVDKLSKSANLSLSALNKLRRGDSAYIRVDTLYALAKALRCSMDELVG